MDAAIAGDVGKTRQHVGEGADIEVRDALERRPLLFATRVNSVEVARLLIDAGADVNAKDSVKDTLFPYAGAEGRNKILKMILATGKANLKDTKSYGGVALVPAAHHGHSDTVRILLSTVININHVNNLGWTVLIEEVILGDGGKLYQEIVGLLLAAGADRSIAESNGATPLAHAKARGLTEIAHLLER
jgi:ankyrin repeat protein